MINSIQNVYTEFWEESHWLPPGHNWSTMQNVGSERYPQCSDLKRPIYYALILLIIRAIFEWGLARPLGRFLGIKDTTSALPNIFHRVFSRVRQFSTRNSTEVIANGHLIKSRRKFKIGLVPKSTLDKFSECCWRFSFYLFIFVYGLCSLWSKDYFWDTRYCWFDYPQHVVTDDIYWYYMFELMFYWSLIFSQFVDVQRKDFWVNFIHHIATVLLMTFSWASNMVRMGVLILQAHDAADFWMEGAKMARYCKRTTLCNCLFAIFATVWFVTRCIYLPFWLLYSALIETVVYVGFYEAYYFINSLLVLLQILHVFWTIIIFKILITALKSGEADDARSDSEDTDDECTLRNSKID
uniref:TLC domain-containing protein n=1 Tax=Romanomermis culicivorax TaxID=13658 RepID=A0A915IXY6_ROMCU